METKDLDLIQHDFSTGWPSAENLFYVCLLCNQAIPSRKDGKCACGNVFVDAGSGRAGALDVKEVALAKRRL
jgi:hypothetical protein